MFLLQLRQLMWKNCVVRSRSKVRVALELLWPLILFLILVLVRLRGLREYRDECFLEEKALPSAGTFRFFKSLVCTFSNNCHNATPSQIDLTEELNYRQFESFINNFEQILSKDVTTNEITAAGEVAKDVLAAVAFLFQTQKNLTYFEISVPLEEILNRGTFSALLIAKSITNITSQEVLNTTKIVIRNPRAFLKELQTSPETFPCNSTYAQFLSSSSKVNDSRQLLCQVLSQGDFLELVNVNGVISTAQAIVEEKLGQPLHVDDWKQLLFAFGRILNDASKLDSLSLILEAVANTSIGRVAKVLWSSPIDRSNTTALSSAANSALNAFCNKTSESIRKESAFDRSERSELRKKFTKVTSANMSYDDLSEVCNQLFIDLDNNPATRLLLEQFYPFIRGKIIFTPNVPAFRPIIESLNETFQELRNVQNLSRIWVNQVSPAIRPALNDSNIESIRTSFNSSLDDSSSPIREHILVLLKNTADQNDKILKLLDEFDYFAGLIDTYIDCYEFDKFEPFDSEDDAVARGMQLMDSNKLWAIIVFEANLNSSYMAQLPRNITYKIRMDSTKIDSTKYIRDFFETPEPRNNPRFDMKYFTSGFIMLQDKIEHAIIRHHTNRTALPGVYMQQFPSPCYVYDTFFMAIAQLFPLFMVLSFVYTCAMIVKSIVREKEQRLKETMRTMGLSNAVHWVAWFLDSFIFMFLICILLSIVLVFGKVLENTDFSVVFVFLFSFSISTICLSFFISTIFSRANLAAACGGFIFFAFFLPFSFLNLHTYDYSLSTLVLLSLFSDVSFGIGCFYIASFEQIRTGAQWYNIDESPKEGDHYSLLGCIVMMYVDSALYILLAWYIEAVFPGEFGIPRPWYFFLQPTYWCQTYKGSSCKVDEESALNAGPVCNGYIEEEPASLKAGVSIRNLGKIYSNGKVALRNLSVEFYEGQITSFLGHNGAGKTTTMSILTGLFPPSNGTATINGRDIRYEMDKIRQNLGLCPQHNVLFDLLTVEEHLLFYAQLKSGKIDENLRQEIAKMINDLGLSHKKNELSRNLSGGMKRKLSIGAAFIGHSKTVILDEPTAGVDPYSRRSIWDLLLKYKEGRTIILTTHFMDEADLLGDRIAIISQGQLKCCGSSVFLKHKFGSGYYLTISKKGNCDPEVRNGEASCHHESSTSKQETRFGIPVSDFQNNEIDSLVQAYITNSELVQRVGMDIVYCLPTFSDEGSLQTEKFPFLFDQLDSNRDRLGIDSYGVSDTTLEEIFLKVAGDPAESVSNDNCEKTLSRESRVLSVLRKIDSRECVYERVPPREELPVESEFTLEASEKLDGWLLIRQQLFALYTKRFCNSKRNLKGFFCEIILPALFLIINQLTTMNLRPYRPEPPLTLTPWLYSFPAITFFADHSKSSVWSSRYITELLNGTGMGVRCMADEYGRRSEKCSNRASWLLNPNADPSQFEDIRCPCNLGIPTCPANASQEELFRYSSMTSDEFYDLTKRDINLWLIQTNKALKKRRSGGFEFGEHHPLSLNYSQLVIDMERLAKAAKLNQFILPSSISNIILDLEKDQLKRGDQDFIKVWYNNKAWASSVSYMNAINNVILRSSLSQQKDKNLYGITVINHPMNYSERELLDKIPRQVGISVLHAIAVIFSMSFVPASFVIFLVEERANKMKHLQFVSGVKPITYWIASYTWDVVNYLIPSILVVLIFLGFQQEAYVGARNIFGMILLLVLYGLSAIPLMYPLSLVFSVPSSAFVGLACGNLFIGIITTISSFVLQLFDDQQLKLIGSILNEVYLIFPHFCLGRGMIDMAQTHFTAQSLESIGLDYQRNIFEWDYLGRYFFAMAVQAVVFFCFTIVIHYRFLPESASRCFKKLVLTPLENEDVDVARERERVESSEVTDPLCLKKLTKIYGHRKQPATNRLSFGLKKGECFGLLGVNGAGKSTTFKMLTGDEKVTFGNAFINGFSVISKLTEARKNLGYCPQEDALLPLLTGYEHLELFARLRGVPKDHLNKVIEQSLKRLGLLPHSSRCAGTYSGGNKRKLCTAIAFIGNPSVVFLDEPSSGMDPKAKRSLWNAVIDAMKGNRSILLTSHSMEECEALCSRLAIMVNGTLKCLGSAQHLKARFGSGYMIHCRCTVEETDEILNSLQSSIPQAKLRERRSRLLVWQVELNGITISELFRTMQEIRKAHQTLDFSITQTTLDDVFVRFARLQQNDNAVVVEG